MSHFNLPLIIVVVIIIAHSVDSLPLFQINGTAGDSGVLENTQSKTSENLENSGNSKLASNCASMDRLEIRILALEREILEISKTKEKHSLHPLLKIFLDKLGTFVTLILVAWVCHNVFWRKLVKQFVTIELISKKIEEIMDKFPQIRAEVEKDLAKIYKTGPLQGEISEFQSVQIPRTQPTSR